MGYSNKIKFIDKKFNRLILRYKLLCLLWSITCLSTGIAFVYANLHECTMDDFDIFLKKNYRIYPFVSLFIVCELGMKFVIISS